MKLINAWKASKEIPVHDTVAVLFGQKMIGTKVSEITGIPPLTFQGVAGVLRNYRISGNTNGVGERTENLFDLETSGGFTDSISDYSSAINGTTIVVDTSTISDTERSSRMLLGTLPAGNYCFHMEWDSKPTTLKIQKNNNGVYEDLIVISGNNTVISIQEQTEISLFAVFSKRIYTFENMMLTSGNTAPETVIPYGYQIPVSVHSPNLFNPAGSVYGYLSETGSIIEQSINNYMTSDFIQFSGAKVKLSFITSVCPTARGIIICAYDANMDFISAPLYESFNSSGQNYRISRTVSVPENTKYIRFSYVIRTSYTRSADEEIELTNGYEIPVYIGSETLDLGEYVRFSEQKIYRKVNNVLTPVEPPVPLPQISVLNGQNILTVGTTVQPSQMYLKGK